MIDNYHSIVDALAEATGDDLSAFKIPAHEVKPKVMATRQPWRKRTGEGDTRSGVVPVYDGVEYVLEVT